MTRVGHFASRWLWQQTSSLIVREKCGTHVIGGLEPEIPRWVGARSCRMMACSFSMYGMQKDSFCRGEILDLNFILLGVLKECHCLGEPSIRQCSWKRAGSRVSWINSKIFKQHMLKEHKFHKGTKSKIIYRTKIILFLSPVRKWPVSEEGGRRRGGKQGHMPSWPEIKQKGKIFSNFLT